MYKNKVCRELWLINTNDWDINCRWSKKLQRSTLLSSVRSKKKKKSRTLPFCMLNMVTCFDCSLFKLRRKCFGASFQPRRQVKAHLWVRPLVNRPALQLTLSLAGFYCPNHGHHHHAGDGISCITPSQVKGKVVFLWQCETRPCRWAQGLPSICPGKQQRLGLHYTFHTPVTSSCECSGLFWLLDLSSVVPQGAQGKMSMESHCMR